MTRRERLEHNLEKRKFWAESRQAKYAECRAAADAVPMAPMGEPIKIGHHSEKRHRKSFETFDNRMRKATEHADMAKHHESRANGISAQLDGSIFSDDPDAIEALTAKVAKLEAEREQIKAINKIIRRKPRNTSTPDKLVELAAIVGSGATAARMFEKDGGGCIGYPRYVLSNLGGNIAAARKRIETIKCRNRNQQAAEEQGGVAIAITGEYAFVVFAEKPEYSLIKELKAAGFTWGGGGWSGRADALPEELAQAVPTH